MPPVAAAIAAAATAAGNFAAGLVLAEAGLGAAGAASLVGTVVASAVEVGIYAGLTIGTALLTAPKVPDPAALQTPLKQSMSPRQSAFGRVRVAGPYALYTVGSGAYKTLSYDILALLDGRSHQFVSFYLNDDLMAENSLLCWFAPGAYGKYGQGTGLGNLVNFDYRLGAPTEIAYTISAQTPVWTSDHRGDGITSMLCRCKQAHKEDQASCFPNGVPTPSAVIDSQLIWNPRDGSQTRGDASTYQFSDNPPLCLLAYLTDASGGMGLNYGRFIAPSLEYLTAAANECDVGVGVSGMHATLADAAAAGANKIFLADTTGLSAGVTITLPTETVTVSGLASGGEVDLTGTLQYGHQVGELAYWDASGQQAQYRCAGTYRHDTPPGEVVKSILSTFDGWLGQRGDGALIVRTNTVYEPSVVLTDRHILGYQVQHYLPDEQATNQYIVSYTDPAAAFNKGDAGYVQDDADIAARGLARSQELYLQWVPSGPQALAVARALLARSIQPLRGTLTCNLAGLAVMGERYVRVQISELSALNDVIVEIAGRVAIDLAAMTVTVPFIANGTSVGETPGPTDSSDAVSVPGPSSGGALDPLTAPTIVSATPDYPDSGGGVQGARLAIVVDDPGLDNLAWKVRWKLSSDSVWASAGDNLTASGSPLTLITGLVAAAGSVDVQVAYSTANQTSPWSSTTTVTTAAPVAGSTTETASEALSARDLVNIYSGGVRKANASTGYEAHGYVTASVAMGATATIYFGGKLTGLSGLTKGPVYLSTTAGGVTNTVPSTSGQLVQQVGVALSATEIDFAPQEGITLR